MLTALGRWSSDIEHVGSTAVPGLAAKPIIDICVGVARLAHAGEMADAMVTLGYDYAGSVGIPEDRVFGRSPGWRTHLVHVAVLGAVHGGATTSAFVMLYEPTPRCERSTTR